MYPSDKKTASMVFQHLSAEDLCRASFVNKAWRALSGSQGLWKKLCSSLWAGKVYVPAKAQELLDAGEAFKAYRYSLLDSKREQLKDDELCSFVWYRRMKKAAGDHWVENDPYWNNKPPNRSRYFPDGTAVFLQTQGFEHPLQEGSEPPMLAWRWVSGSPGSFGPCGSHLRASLAGREFPTMVVSRHSNWGFVMQNCWAMACSFPLPGPGEDPELEDEAQKVNIRTQRDEAAYFNSGIPRLPEAGQPSAFTRIATWTGIMRRSRTPTTAKTMMSMQSISTSSENNDDDDERKTDNECEKDDSSPVEDTNNVRPPAEKSGHLDHQSMDKCLEEATHASGSGSGRFRHDEPEFKTHVQTGEESISSDKATGKRPALLLDLDVRWDDINRRLDGVNMTSSCVPVADPANETPPTHPSSRS
eukprot:scaffold26804_cov40-Prasinocladus_malaysianus.AAC.1